jgi:hypothetical protein
MTQCTSKTEHEIFEEWHAAIYFKVNWTSSKMLYGIFSSGYFPGVWILKADVSEHSVGSIFHLHLPTCEDGTDSVPKRRLLIFSRRGNTQKTIYHIYNTAKVWKPRKCFILAKQRGRIWNRVFSSTRAQHSKCHDIRYDTIFHTGLNQRKSFRSNRWSV